MYVTLDDGRCDVLLRNCVAVPDRLSEELDALTEPFTLSMQRCALLETWPRCACW